jgi:nitrite reductase/ring-hydroxylating ferredoxin subunit
MDDAIVCGESELAEGKVRLVQVGRAEIAVIRKGGHYYAYENVCPHQGGPACEGVMMPAIRDVIGAGGIYRGQQFDEAEMHIVCPWHGYEFRLSDGRHAVASGLGLRRFEAFVRDGSVYVRV